MITKDNYGRYQELFEKVNKLFNYTGTGDEIHDINDYFTALGDIKEKVQLGENKEFDPYLLILPNDEGIFEIDANSRKINIPNDFAKNGVGVQGDELAEIVYFSIDRYFDTTDLYDKDIFVQWEAANGDKGLSVTINKTLYFLPNKVVFGWPITKEMTKKSGNIKFAVRFYERKTEPSTGEISLVYSFSTLTATVKISPALDFNIDTPDDADILKPIDKNATIYGLMRNSEAIGLDATAVAPTFETESFIPADFDAKYDVGEIFEGRAMFKPEDNEDTMGSISYVWHRIDKNKTDTVIGVGKYLYKPNEDISRKTYDIYFEKSGDNYKTYLGSIPPEEGTIVYKRYASYTPDKAGYYYITATNTAGRGNSKSINSNSWLIAFAESPVVVCSDELKHTIITNEAGATLAPEISVEDGGELSYKWYYGENKLSHTLSLLPDENQAQLTNQKAEGYYQVVVTNSKNSDIAITQSEEMRLTMPASDIPDSSTWLYYADDKISDITDLYTGCTIKVELRSPLTYSDELRYQWFVRNSNKEWVPIDGATDKTFIAATTGRYRVKLINEYNNQIKEQESKDFVVSSN